MRIAIKRMVCPRCVATVDRIARQAGLRPSSVELGELALEDDEPTAAQLDRFQDLLTANGFALVETDKARLVNRIKTLIIERIHHDKGDPALKLSSFLSQSLNYDYTHLSKLFSSVEAQTIERFATLQRIERAKELLSYHEQSIAEVAEALSYSSPAHFSRQFKQETGMTPRAFRELNAHPRRPLDAI